MKSVFLGLDSSNYRSSLCVIDEDRKIIFEQKELLSVKHGSRGLMQSEALFQHIVRLPDLVSSLPLEAYEWYAVAASTRPRPVVGSYMPVFRAGEGLGRFAATILQVPFYETTHQEGHIAAGIYSLGSPIKGDRFLAVHLSGGTSELLLVESHQNGYQIELLGGSIDLHAGQLIDRIGVAMGLAFPAGPELEKLAKNAIGNFSLPSAVNSYNFSFSGPESAAMRALKSGINRAEIAQAVQQVIANSVAKVIRKAVLETGIKEVLIVGGVASNLYIKERLLKRLEHPAVKAKLFFTTPEFSGDNAYGVACLALNRFKSEH